MRGTPYIYQGREFGTRNAKFSDIKDYNDLESQNYYKILVGNCETPEEALNIVSERSRDNDRTPVAWDKSKNYGFTEYTP